eukprot:TRINITY_DN3162_c0_g1_i3.p1 TRINITY_DN3162_c0_g1~~TRINITY_DN3162_c0_g1_i3.p1  ORF type:complete len:582 (-),score=123.45 TRINITY_DN3162_c0_g1_i3:62-1807(-)
MSDLSNLSAQSGIPVDFQSGDDLDGFLEKNISAIESLDDRALASVEILNQLLQSPLKSKVLDFGSIQRLIELSLKLEPKDIKRSSLIVNILFSVLNKHSSDEQILQLFQSRIQIPSSGNPTTLLHRLLKLTSTIKAHSQKNTELALRFLGLVSHLGKQENATPADRVTMAKKFPAVLDLFCTVISKMSPAERTKMKSLINEIFYNLKAYPLRQNEEGCCDHAAMAKLYQSGLLDFFLKDCGRPGMTDFGFGLVNISAFGCEAFRVIQNSGIFKNLFKLLRNPEVTPKTKLEIAALISKVTARMFHSPMFFRASKVLNPAENRLILQVLIEDRTEELSELQSNIFHYFFNIFNGNPRGVSDFCSEDLLVAAKRELEKVLAVLEKGKTKSTGSILTDITQFLAVASMTFLRGPKSPVTRYFFTSGLVRFILENLPKFYGNSLANSFAIVNDLIQIHSESVRDAFSSLGEIKEANIKAFIKTQARKSVVKVVHIGENAQLFCTKWEHYFDENLLAGVPARDLWGFSVAEHGSIPDVEYAANSCGFCHKDGATSRCGRCRGVVYCDKNCQTAHWLKEHKFACNAK